MFYLMVFQPSIFFIVMNCKLLQKASQERPMMAISFMGTRFRSLRAISLMIQGSASAQCADCQTINQSMRGVPSSKIPGNIANRSQLDENCLFVHSETLRFVHSSRKIGQEKLRAALSTGHGFLHQKIMEEMKRKIRG